MENNSSVKPSVAELAGRFKGYALPMPTSNEQRKPVRRRPGSLQLLQDQDIEESDKPAIISPFKMKNSAFLEKLQANLALSPTSLVPSPKCPEEKLQPSPLSPASPCSPLSPGLSHTLRPSRQSSEEEEPVGFERPAEGTPLPNFNKSRARLSFKRRPPTRQHRRSTGDEAAGASGNSPSPRERDGPTENGDKAQVFTYPPDPAATKEAGEDGGRAATEDIVPESAPANGAGAASREGQEGDHGDMEEEAHHMESCPTEALGGSSSMGQEEDTQL